MAGFSLKQAVNVIILGEFSLPNEPSVKISLKKSTVEIPNAIPTYSLHVESFGDVNEYVFTDFERATKAFLEAVNSQIAFFNKS